MAAVMVTVSSVLLLTAVTRVVPWKTTTEAETKWLPVTVRTKLAGNCAKTIGLGDIAEMTGTGRELPQRGFSDWQPGRSKTASKSGLRFPPSR